MFLHRYSSNRILPRIWSLCQRIHSLSWSDWTKSSKYSPCLILVRPMPASKKVIAIRGARVNNLRNIYVDTTRDALTVITGVSGSGKSSLAFDTLTHKY